VLHSPLLRIFRTALYRNKNKGVVDRVSNLSRKGEIVEHENNPSKVNRENGERRERALEATASEEGGSYLAWIPLAQLPLAAAPLRQLSSCYPQRMRHWPVAVIKRG